jgi:hypothetical protein
MRFCLALLLALLASVASAEKVILIPLDSRPAAGQFAQMIGSMADVDVTLPPYELLGRFTSAGAPEAILHWLGQQDLSTVSAVIVSTDMIAYGGLIASRTNETTYDTAMHRLRELEQIRATAPKVRFYGFSAIMRLTPTATRKAAAWRLNLGRYAELKERYRRLGTPSLLASLRNLTAKIPPLEIERYEATRARDHKVQESLIRMTGKGLFDYLILGQDDAQPFGPHIPETAHLREVVDHLGIAGRTYFCEGIDQHANVLLSRAILRGTTWVPHIRILYSDPDAKSKIADYESKNIEQSLLDQILASGARPATDEGYDYTLYLNTPGRDETRFQAFLTSLNEEADKGSPISVADINLAKDGTADPELFQSLVQNGRMVKLLSYAGWNTAGNTMGTAVPAANVYLFSRRNGLDPLHREVAQREFLLHRFVNDYSYHKFTRPLAYRLIDATPSANREETYGEDFAIINAFVKRDLGKHLEETFRSDFLGKRFTANGKEYEVANLDGIKIFLPWPRVYEVRLEFKIGTKEVAPVGHVAQPR